MYRRILKVISDHGDVCAPLYFATSEISQVVDF